MKNDLFSVGIIFKTLNTEKRREAIFIVSNIAKDGLKAFDIRSNEPIKLTFHEAQELISQKKLIFQRDIRSQKGISFDDLSEDEQQRAQKKHRLIELLRDRKINKISGTEQTKQAIQDLSNEAGFDTPPHWQSVRSWFIEFKKADEKLKGLYSDSKLRGNRKFQLSKIVEDIISAEIDKFIRPSQPKISSLCRNIENRILEYNIDNPENVQKVPTRNTIVKRYNQEHLERRQKAKKGKSAYSLELANSMAPYATTHILERVEIDHTILDIHLLDDSDKTLLGRPTLTVLIDHYSRMILGLQLSFEAPSFAAVSSACLNAFLPKDEYLKQLEIKAAWPAHGIPETLVTDNGNEFWGENFAEVSMQLGTIFQYAPVKQPNYKGRVERFFGTLNTLLLDDLPGVVRKPHFSNKEYDARQHAKFTFSEFKSYLIEWITSVYHNQPNAEGYTPNELWKMSSELTPIPKEEVEEIQLILLASGEATLNGHGISFSGLKYNSDALKSLYRREGKHKIKFKYNPFDIGEILVLDDKNLVYIKATCLEYHYAKNVSLYEHKLHKKIAREITSQKLTKQDLITSKIKLQNQKDEVRKRNARRKTQITTQKHSRIEKIGVPSFDIETFKTVPDTASFEDEIPVEINKSKDWGIE